MVITTSGMNHSSDNLNLAVTRLAHPLAFAAYLKHLGAPIDRYFQRQRLPALSGTNHYQFSA
jgi:hypothetical protein